MKKEEVKKLLEEKLPRYKAVCLSNKVIKEKLYTEWALVDKLLKETCAVICMADESCYMVKYTAAYASLLKALSELK